MRKKLWIGIAMQIVSISTFAGGILTNTNQNIAFLRNPARTAAIGIDGVYSNPAGVIFLNEGFHLSLNIQNAKQSRTVWTGYGDLFQYNQSRPALQADEYIRKFKGEADAPFIPSVQAAYNRGDWSYQFGFAIVGGGGKCEFANGLGSFEGIVALLNQQLVAAGVAGNGYDMDAYMRGRQYYYGFTLGAAHKLNEHLSVYGGVRVLYGSANYFGYVKNIQMMTADGMQNASAYYAQARDRYNELAGQLEALGMTEKAAEARAAAAQLGTVSAGTADIELNCDQDGVGIAPIIGVDYKTGKFNFAAKYEFKTRMRLKNKSANSASASAISMLDKYADGKKVAEDSPALLTIGAQYEPLPSLRFNVGYHHYFDVDTKQFTGDQLGDTNEYLFGAEYDINKYIQVSAGGQLTRYDMTDGYMNDISYTVSSYSLGCGVGIRLRSNMKLNLAYFQTNYEDYKKTETMGQLPVRNTFTRTNRVLGIGLDMTF